MVDVLSMTTVVPLLPWFGERDANLLLEPLIANCRKDTGVLGSESRSHDCFNFFDARFRMTLCLA